MQMQTLGHFCFFVVGFYHRFFRLSLRFFLLLLMDLPSTFKFLTQASELGCGFVLLGYFSRLFNLLGLLLIFVFCFRILLNSPNPRPRPRSLQKPSPKTEEDENSREDNVEDDMFDVMSLRKLVKMERQRFNAACAEIEKERGAAASAAEEAMAMILRLQSEKSAVEIQAKQFRRVVEQKEEYDQEVIESLSWTVVRLEEQKSLLEEQLGVYKEKLRQFMKDEEIEQLEEVDDDSSFLNFTVEYDDSLDDASLHSPTLTPVTSAPPPTPRL